LVVVLAHGDQVSTWTWRITLPGGRVREHLDDGVDGFGPGVGLVKVHVVDFDEQSRFGWAVGGLIEHGPAGLTQG
jgi:hypothetical protein